MGVQSRGMDKVERIQLLADKIIEYHASKFMNAREAFFEAIRALRVNKLRSLLATLGVAIGSACVVLVVTVSLSADTYITGLIESIGSNLVYAEFNPSGIVPTPSDWISQGDIQAVRRSIPQVAHAAGSRNMLVEIVAGGSGYPATLLGVTEEFQDIRRLWILRGSYFDESDMEMRSKVCLLSEELAKVIFPSDDPVGKSIRSGEVIYTVIGVFRERGATLGAFDIQENTVLIPFSLLKYLTGRDDVRYLYAEASSMEDVSLVAREVRAVLKSRHRAEALYRVESLSSLLSAARRISLALMLILLAIGLITLTVGGVNIMNIMLVIVTERTREIGVRRAVGARQTDIRWQFLLEAVLISGLGAMAGIVVAGAASMITRSFLPGQVSAAYLWLSIALAFGVSSVVGIAFGYWPADKAAKLDPSEALRFE
jgi:putative ABC transport system permease protein